MVKIKSYHKIYLCDEAVGNSLTKKYIDDSVLSHFRFESLDMLSTKPAALHPINEIEAAIARFKTYLDKVDDDLITHNDELTDPYQGICSEKDVNIAITKWKQAGRNAEEAYYLALCFYFEVGKDSDEKQCFDLFNEAAKQGYAAAQHSLGRCYEYGYGDDVEQDDEEAFKYYKQAADNGYVHSQWNVARCYEAGEGTKEDFEKAFHYFK